MGQFENVPEEQTGTLSEKLKTANEASVTASTEEKTKKWVWWTAGVILTTGVGLLLYVVLKTKKK